MSLSRPAVAEGIFHAATKIDQGESVFKKNYSKVINTAHARDFLAECLATFMLVVRIEYYFLLRVTNIRYRSDR